MVTPAVTRNIGLGVALVLIVIAGLAVAGHGAVVDAGVNDTGALLGGVDHARSALASHARRTAAAAAKASA